MNLTLEEKEKLLQKAKKLYEEIKEIKIRKEISIGITRKYYDFNNSWNDFVYYKNGTMSIHRNNIENTIEKLNNYINYKKYNGPEYINHRSVIVETYDTDILLDFIYNGTYILETIKNKNEKERQELKNLLD